MASLLGANLREDRRRQGFPNLIRINQTTTPWRLSLTYGYFESLLLDVIASMMVSPVCYSPSTQHRSLSHNRDNSALMGTTPYYQTYSDRRIGGGSGGIYNTRSGMRAVMAGERDSVGHHDSASSSSSGSSSSAQRKRIAVAVCYLPSPTSKITRHGRLLVYRIDIS